MLFQRASLSCDCSGGNTRGRWSLLPLGHWRLANIANLSRPSPHRCDKALNIVPVSQQPLSEGQLTLLWGTSVTTCVT